MKFSGAILLLIWVCFGFIKKPQPIDPPNILIIEVDDLTAKYLGFYGAKFAQTPCADEIMENGVVFENAVVQGTMCTPSRNSVITGMYPHNLGMYHNLDIIELPKGIWTFPKELQKLGYQTMWVGKNHLLPNLKGIKGKSQNTRRQKGMISEMGFNSVNQSLGRSLLFNKLENLALKGQSFSKVHDDYVDYLKKSNLLEKFIEEGGNKPTSLDPNKEYMDGYFTTMAIHKMDTYKNSKPFLMWLNFSGPHIPFDPPKEYIDMFEDRYMPIPIDTLNSNFIIPDELQPVRNTKTRNGILNYRKRYKGAIAYMDTQLGRILDFIKNSRFSENTMIVFFSDHGIMTGDHGILGKETLFKEVLNPSLAFYYPNAFAAKRITKAVELIDVGKTLVDIAGGNTLNLNQVPHGNSLLPLLKGVEGFMGKGYGISEVTNYRSIFDGQYKYIDHPVHPILFNLQLDPDEKQNRIIAEHFKAEELKKVLNEWLENSGEVIPGPQQKSKNNSD